MRKITARVSGTDQSRVASRGRARVGLLCGRAADEDVAPVAAAHLSRRRRDAVDRSVRVGVVAPGSPGTAPAAVRARLDRAHRRHVLPPPGAPPRRRTRLLRRGPAPPRRRRRSVQSRRQEARGRAPRRPRRTPISFRKPPLSDSPGKSTALPAAQTSSESHGRQRGWRPGRRATAFPIRRQRPAPAFASSPDEGPQARMRGGRRS